MFGATEPENRRADCTSALVGCRIAGIAMTELIPPMRPLLAIMFGVLLCVTYVPESFMWLPRMFGFAR